MVFNKQPSDFGLFKPLAILNPKPKKPSRSFVLVKTKVQEIYFGQDKFAKS